MEKEDGPGGTIQPNLCPSLVEEESMVSSCRYVLSVSFKPGINFCR